MKTSLNIDTRGVKRAMPMEGLRSALNAVSALTKSVYLGARCEPDLLLFLESGGGGTTFDDTTSTMRLVNAMRWGDRTAFYINYRRDGHWWLCINVIKGKRAFAFVEISFDRHSDQSGVVQFYRLPPADQVRVS